MLFAAILLACVQKQAALIEGVKAGDLSKVRAALAALSNPNAREILISIPDLSTGEPGGRQILGDTALLIAIRHENLKIVQLLLSAKADPNLPGVDDEAPLVAAIKSPSILELLLKKGARTESHDKYGNTAFDLAANQERYPSLKILLSWHAKVDTNHGWTALMSAAYSNQTTLVKWLLRAGANANARRLGSTPLECAYMNYGDDAAAILQRAGGKGRTKSELDRVNNAESDKEVQEERRKRQVEAAKHAKDAVLTPQDSDVLNAIVEDIYNRKADKYWPTKPTAGEVIGIVEKSHELWPYSVTGISYQMEADSQLVSLDVQRNLLERNLGTVSLKNVAWNSKRIKVVREPGSIFDHYNDFRIGRAPDKDVPNSWFSLSLPGYNSAHTIAVCVFSYYPTAHGSAGAFLLEKAEGKWRVRLRYLQFYV